MITKSPRRRARGLRLAGAGVLVFCLGCSSLDLFSKDKDPGVLPLEDGPGTLIGDVCIPYGMFPVSVEGIGLVTCLPDTGSDPPPSPHRDALLKDMTARGVPHPSQILASKTTEMVLLHGILSPGIQEGDTFDVEVRTLGNSETTSLRGGFLLDTRLREMQILQDQQVHKGRDWGIARGAVLVDPSVDTEKRSVLSCRGRILGGGRALRSRSLGLVLNEQHQNAFYSAQVANSINKRFYATSGGGLQEGMAKAHTDQYIELKVHPRYKDNIPRYMQVVRSLALRETSPQRTERMGLLAKELLDPITSAPAALQLEAIGGDGVEVLKKGLASKNMEVRFRSAEALAYLDETQAVDTLAAVSRDEPAFRVFALTALATMNDPLAYEQLCRLLESPSAETRYGAFRALWTMNPMDRRVLGEKLANDFSYHVLPTTAPPMIHVTRSRRPEVVLFGEDQRLSPPLLLEAGPRIRVRSEGPDQIAVTRFTVNQPDQKRIVSTRVDDVVRAIAELGGTYPDVVQALQQAKKKGALASRFEIDALPEAGRRYERVADAADSESAQAAAEATAKRSPFAIFTRTQKSDPPEEESPPPAATEIDPSADPPTDVSVEEGHPVRSFFAKMTGQGAE